MRPRAAPGLPRRHGVATALLRNGLDQLADRGIVQARLSCLDSNLASSAIIERAGGERLADKVAGRWEIVRRYAVPTHACPPAKELLR